MKKSSAVKRIFVRTIIGVIGVCGLILIMVGVVFFLLNKTNGEIDIAGQVRTYLLYVPSTYNPSIPTPLVISLHGFAEWPAHQMKITGWSKLAEEFGFIVIYPSGTRFPLRWNTQVQPGSPDGPMNEVTFISDLIDQLAAEYNIDKNRIYANGFSNGGGMSYLLACKLSDRIAAIGSVAGAYSFPWDECTPSRPMPMIIFHGTADQIVPFNGENPPNLDFSLPAISNWVKLWVDFNKCDEHPIELPVVGEVSGVKYTQCAQNARVIFYTVHGGGHAWPGGEPMPKFIVGHTSQDIDATAVMWEFFQQYSLGN
jgi:polyhydroxybutyrate depolymerase